MQETILGYIGPETVLPVASVFAAIVGGVLMFGKWIWRSVVAATRFLRRQK